MTRLLEADLDTHLITLKFLGLFGPRCQVRLESDETGWASLVWFDAQLFAWDRDNYPQARFVVFLDGSSPRLVAAMARQFPEGPLVVKSSDPRALTVLEENPSLVCSRKFLWYTADGPRREPPDGVREIVGPDEHLDALLMSNGYSAADVAEFWRRGARGYEALDGDEVAAFCLVYPNHGPVWEIASVKTLEGRRRQGFGTRLVRAAMGSILARGHRIRYHVDADNAPSRALAESVGLRACVEARHYCRGF